MKTIVSMILLFACILAATLLSCADDSNPYLDQSKSAIALVAYDGSGQTLTDGDSVDIFATDTFWVELTLQVHIERFRFTAPNNRLWMPDEDTLIDKATFGDIWRFPFLVSFYQTGYDTVTVTAYLAGGDSLSDSLIVYCRSPLDQDEIEAEPGELVDLQTTPVEDSPVLYVWKIGTDSVVNDQSHTRKQFDSPLIAQGELYVKLGQARSPSQVFQIVVADRTPPSVTLLHDSVSADSAHIYTGDIPFHFHVRIADSYSDPTAPVVYAPELASGAPFDQCTPVGPHAAECTKTLYFWAEDSDSSWIVVAVADESGNHKADTFWVHYDSSLVSTPIVRIDEPAQDLEVVPHRQLTVFGDVENMYGDDSLYLIATVNDSDLDGYRTITKSSTTWEWPVELSAPDTNVVMFALLDLIVSPTDTLYQVVHYAYRIVVLDTAVADSTPPSIRGITSGGVPVTDGFVAAEQTIALRVDVFDQSGIAWVQVDSAGAPLQPDGAYLGTVVLEHVPEGVVVPIAVADNKGNVTETTRRMYHNHAPAITAVPALTYIIADMAYEDRVLFDDPDGDPVTVTLLIKARTGDKVVAADGTGAFVWTPGPLDTGLTEIVAQATDGYPGGRDEETFNVVVKPPDVNDTVQAFFTVDMSDFPSTLTATVDTLRVLLAIDRDPSEGDFLFSVRRFNGNVSEHLLRDSRDNQLVWAPAEADTGTWTIEAVVTSGPGLADTIIPAPVINVLPAPEPLTVRFGVGESTVKEDTGKVYLPVLLSRPAAADVTVSYRVNTTATDADSLTDYSLPDMRWLTFAAGDTVAQLPVSIVDDGLLEGAERVVLFLKGVTPVDSATIAAPSSHTCYILDNEISAGTDTLSVLSQDQGGAEGDYVVPVRVGLRAPAYKDINVHFYLSGSATHGTDYSLATLDYLIRQGENELIVELRILDDTECERQDETVRLTLETNTPEVVVLDNSFQYVINRSLENCPPYVAFVYGAEKLDPFEEQIIDTLQDALGYGVAPIHQGQVGNQSYGGYDAVLISGSVNSPAVGQRLANVAVPVLCASPINRFTLGLAVDTGHEYGNMIELSSLGGVGLFGKQPITESYALIPWARAERDADVIAALPGYGGLGGWDQHTPVVIYRYNAGDIPGHIVFPPDRRCVFPVCESPHGGRLVYTNVWWALLRYCVTWTTSGGVHLLSQ
ncbi:MAG: hypothetical protein GF331_04745 [Chitinivibrionales bacterium]|nr:hypothetical protein [Chitinivibrionales bacterium]